MTKTQHTLAFNLFVELKKLVKQQGFLFLDIGRLLKTIRDNKLYKLLDIETFNAFIAQPEIGLSRSLVYGYITIYETYIQKYGYPVSQISSVPYSKLLLIAPRIKDGNKKKADQLLTQATTLSMSDLRQELTDPDGEPKPRVEITKCNICNKWRVRVLNVPAGGFCQHTDEKRGI